MPPPASSSPRSRRARCRTASPPSAVTVIEEFYANLALNGVPDSFQKAFGVPGEGLLRRVGEPDTAQRQGALRLASLKAKQVAADLFEVRVCKTCHDVLEGPATRGRHAVERGARAPRQPLDAARELRPQGACRLEVRRLPRRDRTRRRLPTSSMPTIEGCRECHGGSQPGREEGDLELHAVPRVPRGQASLGSAVRSRAAAARVAEAQVAWRASARLGARRARSPCWRDARVLRAAPRPACRDARRRPKPSSRKRTSKRVIAQAVGEAQARGLHARHRGRRPRRQRARRLPDGRRAAQASHLDSGRGVTGGLDGIAPGRRAGDACRDHQGDHRRVPVVGRQRLLDAHREPDRAGALQSRRGAPALGAALRRAVLAAPLLRREPPPRRTGRVGPEALAARPRGRPGRACRSTRAACWWAASAWRPTASTASTSTSTTSTRTPRS